MADVEVTREAEWDLREISDYTAKHFGEAQADALSQGFLDSFELLEQYPLMGGDCGRIVPNARRLVRPPHVIYYRYDGATVLIIRILGPGQDPARHLGASD